MNRPERSNSAVVSQPLILDKILKILYKLSLTIFHVQGIRYAMFDKIYNL